ncbi:MAG TPA: hypothetical protein VGE01_07730 [Fimbriimonas sp.]
MQQFEYPDGTTEPIRLSEDEARAMAALHAHRRQTQSQQSLTELAVQLGITETEAMALLTEVRAGSPAVPRSENRVVMHLPPERHLSSSAWALIALAAAIVVVTVGLFLYLPARAHPGDAVFAESGAFPEAMSVPPLPAPPAPPIVIQDGERTVTIQPGN